MLVKEVVTLYDAYSKGKESPLPELPVQYADFAVWQRGWLQGEELEKQMAYWRKQLEGELPVLELPTDRRATGNAELSRYAARFPVVAGDQWRIEREYGPHGHRGAQKDTRLRETGSHCHATLRPGSRQPVASSRLAVVQKPKT